MKMKKITSLILITVLLFSICYISASAAVFGSGVEVIAKNVKVIRSSLKDTPVTIKEADFKQALIIDSFNKIKITKLPSENEGTLTLSGRKLNEGAYVRRRNLPNLVFTPKSGTTEASFEFSIDDYMGGESIVYTMKFLDEINYAPEIVSGSEEALSYITQRGISVFGKLEATDKEGDELEYIIVSYPENGILSHSSDTPEVFKYTPNKGYQGKDSFTFVVRDEYGNYSKPEKISLKTTERISEVVYSDMLNSPAYNAAVAMTGMGIMSGTRIGDNMYFMPDGTVTRAEFVAMAMKAVGMSANKELTETFFDDNSIIPEPLVSYVATAQRNGIINGAFDGEGLKFRPNDPITKYEAGIIMSNLIDLENFSISVSVEEINKVPVWARSHYSIMCQIGVFEPSTKGAMDSITRGEASEYLYKISMFME